MMTEGHSGELLVSESDWKSVVVTLAMLLRLINCRFIIIIHAF